MNSNRWVIVGALVFAASINAVAQDTQPPAPKTAAPSNSYSGDEANHWLASGFVGSNFANNAQPASMNFGGSVAYLWKDRYGAEVDAGFTPNFQLQNNFFGLGVKPQVNSYMANAVFAKPIGDDNRFQPFVSAGAGALSLRSGLSTTTTSGIATAVSPDDTRFGGDVGGGVLGFSGNWGFKADVRYFRAAGTYNTTSGSAVSTSPTTTTPAPGPYGMSTMMAGAATTAAVAPAVADTSTTTSLASAVLSGLHFWRANVGVAFRW